MDELTASSRLMIATVMMVNIIIIIAIIMVIDYDYYGMTMIIINEMKKKLMQYIYK